MGAPIQRVSFPGLVSIVSYVDGIDVAFCNNLTSVSFPALELVNSSSTGIYFSGNPKLLRISFPVLRFMAMRNLNGAALSFLNFGAPLSCLDIHSLRDENVHQGFSGRIQGPANSTVLTVLTASVVAITGSQVSGDSLCKVNKNGS